VIAAWLFGVALAACPEVAVAELAALPPPAILVLGERHGHRGDLRAARRVVAALAARGPTTLALEAAHSDQAAAIRAFNAGDGSLADLRDGLRWGETWGFRWGPYKRLFALRDRGVTFVAAGLKLGPAPDGADVAIPEGYGEILAEAMGAHGASLDEAGRARFARSMAWRDLRIGQLAVEGWDGRGVLVVLTGRGHVEREIGTPWQIRRFDERSVHAALLAPGDDGACAAGDRVVGR
jgi:uncharacterized iron-regulated protein